MGDVKSVCVILPALNEEEGIGTVLDEILDLTLPNTEVIVVDNGSTDLTSSIAKAKGVRVIFESRRGKGRAIRTALEKSTAEYIVMLDADWTYPAMHIPEVVKALDKYPVVMGSRLRGHFEDGSMSRINNLGNRLLTFFANTLYNTNISDLCTGLWGFRREVIENITLTANGFQLEADLFVQSALHNYTIGEIPINYRKRKGQVKLGRVSDGYKIAIFLLKNRLINYREPVFKTFQFLVKPLKGKGIGNVRLIGRLYRILEGNLLPTTQRLVTVNDCLMLLETQRSKEIDGIARQLIFNKSYEPITTNILLKYLKSGMKVIDVGANIGYFTLLASKCVGRGGYIWAFEPEEHNFQALCDNVKRNGLINITPLMQAVSDTNGIRDLYVSNEESGEHSLVVKRHHGRTVIVKTIALDSMFLLDSVDVIKIDTEGNDIKVLQGAKNLIKRSNPLLITEFWPEGITKCGFTPSDFWNLLREFYQHIYIADEVEKTLSKGTLELALKHCDDRKFSVNLIGSKEELNVLER